MNRRKFILIAAALTGLGQRISSCKAKKAIKGKIVGASQHIGHLLRDKKFSAPAEAIKKKVVIIGGGISGLSAARHLYRQGIEDFLVLDLEPRMGGNAAYGANPVSAYPWGAHYIPIPNNNLTEYIDFLKECHVITGTNHEGLPVYNDYYLCFDPEERLYINGHWQEGLVPESGVPEADKKEIVRFLEIMDGFRYKTGQDGKEAFAIPVDASSKDKALTKLDSITMKEWLLQNGLTSSYLHWYVNYCTRDDYGTTYDKACAWAGIHYFACRKGKAANATHQDVLTWPEGNGWLSARLQQAVTNQLRNNCLVVKVAESDAGVYIEYFDLADQTLKAIDAEHCIAAVPQFVADRLLEDHKRQELVQRHFQYTPWMVANLKVSALQERNGRPLSWDNVLYDSDSLGYVEATHQLLQQNIPQKNLSYYLPLTAQPPAEARKLAQLKSHQEWVELVMADLQKVHPNIREATEEVNIMLWGHAMAQPIPGMIHGSIRKELLLSAYGRIHFAHTDLAGISIFEEAFYQGLYAAKKVLDQLG